MPVLDFLKILPHYSSFKNTALKWRIVFKILLIVFNANGQAPSYILELLTLKSNSHDQ